MPIELRIFLSDDTTEEEQKAIARHLFTLPTVLGVYRPAIAPPPGVTVTHETPRMTQ